jgi:hypothetical protein
MLMFMQRRKKIYTSMPVSLCGLIDANRHYTEPLEGDSFVVTWYEGDCKTHLSGYIRLTCYKRRGKSCNFFIVPIGNDWPFPLPPRSLYFNVPLKSGKEVESLSDLMSHYFVRHIFALYEITLESKSRSNLRQHFTVVKCKKF